MTRYFLQPSVHLCFTPDGAVFLDLKCDQYLGLDALEAKVLRRMVDGAYDSDVESGALARELLQAGLLSTGPGERSRPLAATCIEGPNGLLLDPDICEEAPRLTFLHVCRFLAACVSVFVRLNLGSLERAIFHLQARKSKLAAPSTVVDLNAARALVRVFVHLRTFVYTASEHCLFDSLVLSEFLWRFGIASNCIFAVRTLPFGAHCWVQVDRMLATEASAEHLAAFSPILAI